MENTLMCQHNLPQPHWKDLHHEMEGMLMCLHNFPQDHWKDLHHEMEGMLMCLHNFPQDHWKDLHHEMEGMLMCLHNFPQDHWKDLHHKTEGTLMCLHNLPQDHWKDLRYTTKWKVRWCVYTTSRRITEKIYVTPRNGRYADVSTQPPAGSLKRSTLHHEMEGMLMCLHNLPQDHWKDLRYTTKWKVCWRVQTTTRKATENIVQTNTDQLSTRQHIRGSLMFCNLVLQQHLQPLCLLHIFEETPLSMYTRLQLLCARWYCHDGAVDHGHPFEDAIHSMPGRL